jgi:hypothetical protein
MLVPYRAQSTIITTKLFFILFLFQIAVVTEKAMGQEGDENESESSSPSADEKNEEFSQKTDSDEGPIDSISQSNHAWPHRLSLSGSQWSAAYEDRQKNHVTQATKNVSGLPVKGQTIGISWLRERDLESDSPQAWLYQGSLSTWRPQSEYWLRSTVAQVEGGFGIIPASGPKMVFVGIRYQKNTYQETTEKWSEVKLEDQALLTLGAQLRHTLYDTDLGLSIYVSGKAYALFWDEKYSGYGADAILGVSQLFGDDWRLNIGLGVEQQQITSEAKSPYEAPLTLLSELQSFPMVLSLEF